jgi:hypothetical protein
MKHVPSFSLIVMLATFVATGQTVVTFSRGTFLLNGKPFFPIGWYGLHTSADLDAVRPSGVNVVLNYWNDVCYYYPPVEYTARGYAASLKRFLAVAGSRDIKVIVHLPMQERLKRARLIDDAFLQTVVGDSLIRTHPAVLGWYQADEPEQTAGVTRGFLTRRYNLLKRLDPAHPVFVVFGVSAKFNKRFPEGGGKFYDVLMADSYPVHEGDPVPAKDLSGWQAQQLRGRLQRDGIGGAGTTVFVAQGNGRDEYKPRKRNPTPLEIKFQVLSYLHWAQHHNGANAGGMLFWWYKPSDSQCRKNISDFIRYFTGNRLDVVIRQERVASEETYPLVTFLRFFEDNLYLFAVNESDSLIRDARLVLDIDRYADCTELVVPLATTRTKTLTALEPGKYQLIETFGRRESRVYRIRR